MSTGTRTRRKNKPQAAWLLVLLTFLAATLPSLSTARFAADGSLRIEVCSARSASPGLTTRLTIAVPSVDFDSTAPGQHSARPHCPLCISADASATIPPLGDSLLIARLDLLERAGPAHTPELRLLPRLTFAQPRAPPLSA